MRAFPLLPVEEEGACMILSCGKTSSNASL
jgi:hypothetical protein